MILKFIIWQIREYESTRLIHHSYPELNITRDTIWSINENNNEMKNAMRLASNWLVILLVEYIMIYGNWMNKLISSVGLSMYRHAILFFLSKKDSLTIYLVDLHCECSILCCCKSRILSSRSKYELILVWFSWYMLLRE